MKMKRLRTFSDNLTFHYIPNMALYTVKFPTVKIYSVRFHFLLFRFGFEIAIDFKTK